jgi:hypothetical protein
MNVEPLVRAVIVAMMLLENSSDTDISPDVAVGGMESVVGELLMIEERDRPELLHMLANIGEAEGESDVGMFVRFLPFVIGLNAPE